MAFFAILEPILVILVLAGLVSQCLIPELLGQPWCPLFRRIGKLRAEIAKAEEDALADTLAVKLNTLNQDHHNQVYGENNGNQATRLDRPDQQPNTSQHP